MVMWINTVFNSRSQTLWHFCNLSFCLSFLMKHYSQIGEEKANLNQEKCFNKSISNSTDRSNKSIKLNNYAFCVICAKHNARYFSNRDPKYFLTLFTYVWNKPNIVCGIVKNSRMPYWPNPEWSFFITLHENV